MLTKSKLLLVMEKVRKIAATETCVSARVHGFMIMPINARCTLRVENTVAFSGTSRIELRGRGHMPTIFQTGIMLNNFNAQTWGSL